MEIIQNIISQIKAPCTTKTFEELLQDPDVQNFLSQHEVSREVLHNSKSRINEFVVAKSRSRKTGLIPTLFLNLNFIDVRYEQSDELIAKKEQARRMRLFKTETLGKNTTVATFDNIHFTHERKELLMAVQKFIESYSQTPQGSHQGMFLSGGYGIGKSFILSAMGHDLSAKGFEVRMEHFPTLVNRLHAKPDYSDKVAEVDRIKKAPILILDDFGSETMTSWLRDSVILVLLEYRMANDLPTFMTSNLRLKDIPEYLARAREGVDYMKSDRIMQRIKFLMYEMYLTGQNRRLSR